MSSGPVAKCDIGNVTINRKVDEHVMLRGIWHATSSEVTLLNIY
jgi:hypothetical protein